MLNIYTLGYKKTSILRQKIYKITDNWNNYNKLDGFSGIHETRNFSKNGNSSTEILPVDNQLQSELCKGYFSDL